MALNTCDMWSNGIKIAFYFKKLQKIAQRLGASSQDHYSHRRLGAAPPHLCLWNVWVTLAYSTRFLTEVESRTQGSRPRPRTQKKSETKAKNSLSENRHSQGQGQKCSRPRPRTKDTSASALQKKKVFTKNFQAISKKKRSSQTFFRRSPQKNVFQKIFQALLKIFTIQKIVLSSSRGQANFRGLEASRPRPRTWPSRPRPRTSKCVLKAKDVLEDSTSVS